MMRFLQILSIVLLIVLSGTAASYLQTEAVSERDRKAFERGAHLPPSPTADFIVASLGGFRSIVMEIVWFRANHLQSEGRFAELAQLGAWLTYLDPYSPEVWAYTAWNLSYNVSVMMRTPADRWRWVEAGLKLLRDDGLKMNPRSPELCREIAWLFLLKMSIDTDRFSYYYREEWRKKAEQTAASDDWSSVMMIPAVMSELEKEYGKLDWGDTVSIALYWAHFGLQQSPSPTVELNLRQLKYQCFMMFSKSDPRFIPLTIKEMEATYEKFPGRALEDLIKHFKQRNNIGGHGGGAG